MLIAKFSYKWHHISCRQISEFVQVHTLSQVFCSAIILFPVRRIKEQPSSIVDMALGSIKYVDFINESKYEDSLKSLIQGIIKK